MSVNELWPRQAVVQHTYFTVARVSVKIELNRSRLASRKADILQLGHKPLNLTLPEMNEQTNERTNEWILCDQKPLNLSLLTKN